MAVNVKKTVSVGDFRLGNEEKKAIIEVLDSGRLSEGKKVHQFEKQFASYIGTRYSVAVNSGTSAIMSLLLALKYDERFSNVRENTFIITTPITYVATSNAIVLSGFKPVYVDIDPDTFAVIPEQVEELLKSCENCSVILPVHLMGFPCDMNEINSLANKYGAISIEDSSQAHGSLYNGSKTGSLSLAGTFSFYIAHNIQAGELGAVTTNDEILMENIKRIKANGRLCSCPICTRNQNYCKLVDLANENEENEDPRFKHSLIGANFKAMEFQAALGLIQLSKVEQIIEKRLANVKYLNERLSHFHKYIKTPVISDNISYLAYPLTVKRKSGISRWWLTSNLEKHGIETRPLFGCIPTQQPAYSYLKNEYIGKLPNAEYIGKNSFYIGCHQYLEKEDLDYVINTFERIFKTV